jgi:hypothetical protein
LRSWTLVDRHRRSRIGRLGSSTATHVSPQTDAEVGFADEATRRMIAEET